MRDEAVKTLGYIYGLAWQVSPDKLSEPALFAEAQRRPAHGFAMSMRWLMAARKMTPPLDRAISDAIQPLAPEDFDDGDKVISAQQQCMWDLAFYHGKAAPILNDPDYLAEKMREKGLTLEQVGNVCGMSRQAVSDWTSGRRPIPQKHKATLAEVLGIYM